MPPNGSLPSPHQSSSAAGHSPQTYSECSIIYGPGHRVVPSNASGVLCGSSTPTSPRQNPSAAAAGWSRPASPVSSPVSSRSGKKIKPKIPALPRSSLPGRSPAQQSAATNFKRTKSGNRTTHNDVERKYRTNLKDRLAQLRAAVPTLQAQQDNQSDGAVSHAAPQLSKGTILIKATEYIQQLEQTNRIMTEEHQKLVERLQTLEAMFQNNNACPPQYTADHGMTMLDPCDYS